MASLTTLTINNVVSLRVDDSKLSLSPDADGKPCCCCPCPPSGQLPTDDCQKPILPLKVYRTGGISGFRDGVPFDAAGCEHTLVGEIKTVDETVDVSWTAGFSYSSVEVQVQDACGRCVYYGNKATSGPAASITVRYSDCALGAVFGGGIPWCNNPMCPLPWTAASP